MLAVVEIVSEVFGYRLLKPVYAGVPYITCQYLKGIPTGNGFGGLPPLDVSTTGSGFHQVLLILAFMFARPSSLILLDEPEAHLHVLLQKQIYDILRRLCHFGLRLLPCAPTEWGGYNNSATQKLKMLYFAAERATTAEMSSRTTMAS